MAYEKDGYICLGRAIPTQIQYKYIQNEICIKGEKITAEEFPEKVRSKINELKNKGYNISVVVRSSKTGKYYIEYWNHALQDYEVI